MTTDPNEWAYGDYTPNPLSRDLIALKANWILSRLPTALDPVVLDYGAGEGKYLHLIRGVRPRARLVGVDIRAPKSPADFEFHLVPDGAKLPFPEDVFDLVISCDVLEHVTDIRESLDEIHRVLRSGGLFIGFVPLEGGFGPHGFFRLFNPNIYLATKDHRHAYRREQIVSLMETRFHVTAFAYSYHLLGGLLDAVFFASFKFPGIGRRMEEFWRGQENSFYRRASSDKKLSPVGRVTRIANWIAYWESRILHRVPFGASGLHFCLEKKNGA
jgi:SAM-dependent methyltransferase